MECKYLIVGRERGEEGNTPHLQGYIVFENLVSFNQVKRLLGDGAHIEKANGTAEQNRTYCCKDNDYFECGIMPSQGKRTDLDKVRDSVRAGKSLKDISDEVCYVTMREQFIYMILTLYTGIVLPGASVRRDLRTSTSCPSFGATFGLLVLRPYGYWEDAYRG